LQKLDLRAGYAYAFIRKFPPSMKINKLFSVEQAFKPAEEFFATVELSRNERLN